MFSHSSIIDEFNNEHQVITFGPVSVLPEFHNQGIGSALIEYAKKAAFDLGYKAIMIYGYKDFYSRLGFKNAKEYDICDPYGKYPAAHLALELYEGALTSISGKAFESEIFNMDRSEVEEFDKRFPYREKMLTDTQRKFEIESNRYL